MDVIDMRVAITVISFITFIGIVVWAYSGRQKERFDDAANLPFADDDMQQRTVESADHSRVTKSSSKQAESRGETSHG